MVTDSSLLQKLRSTGDSSTRRIEWALDVIQAHCSDTELIESICAHLHSQTKKDKLLEAGAETCVAAWLARHDLLARPPAWVPERTDVIDFGLCGTNLGIEVKTNRNRVNRDILDGQHKYDKLALRPFIRKIFGRDAIVDVRWGVKKPSYEEWGPLRPTVITQCKRELVSFDGKVDMEREYTVTVAPIHLSNSQRTRLFIKIAREFHVSCRITRLGDGWGKAATRVIRHATKKSEKSDTQFILTYFSHKGDEPVVTPSRLEWAWDEIEAERPDGLAGVICLEQERNPPFDFSAAGRLTSVASTSPGLPMDSLPPKRPKTTAGDLWAKIRARLHKHAKKTGDERLNEFTAQFSSSSCNTPGADDLVEHAAVYASKVGLKLPLSRSYFRDNPFPCSPETEITLQVSEPRR